MVYIVFVLTGVVIGSGSDEGAGFILGGLLGFVFAWVYSMRQSLHILEVKVAQLEQHSTIQTEDENHIEVKELVDKECDKSIEEQELETQPDSANESKYKPTYFPASSSQKNLSQQHASYKPQEYKEKEYQHESEKAIEIRQQPGFLDSFFDKAKEFVLAYFTGGNTLVRTGMLVLFVGIAFLLKYVAQRTTLPIEYRYYGIVLASFVMLFLGWKLRTKRRTYALSLQGGGVGLLYLTLFAAMRIHDLLPPSTVMTLLVVIVGATAFLAVVQDSLAFAVIGLIGGFAAPILTSTGHGSHVQLFSYYLLLDLGVFFIAWFKSWRILNVVGFVATFGIGTAWGYQYYKPEFFNTVEPFLVTYFVLYSIIAVLFALKQAPKLRGINDSTLVFGTPLVSFSLQAALLEGSRYGLAYSAIAVSAFYIVLLFVIRALKKPYMKTLSESFVALAIGFGTLAIPLAFDGRVTSAFWVVEAAAMAWIGIKQNRILPRFAGYLLMFFAAGAYFLEASTHGGSLPWLNADYIGVLLVSIGMTFIGYYAFRNQNKLFKIEVPLIAHTLVTIGVLFWLFGGFNEINFYYKSSIFVVLQTFYAVTVIGLLYVIYKTHYLYLKNMVLITLFMAFAAFVYMPSESLHFTPLLNQRFAGMLIFTLSLYFASWYFHSLSKTNRVKDNSLSIALLVVALLMWTLTGLLEIDNSVAVNYRDSVGMLFIFTSFVLQIVFAHRISWLFLAWLKYAMLPVIVALGLITIDIQGDFHQNYAWFVWLFAFVSHYFVLYQYKGNWAVNINYYHLLGLLFFSFVVVFEGGELVAYLMGDDSIWFVSSYAATLLLISTGLYRFSQAKSYPLSTYPQAYYVYGLPLILLVLWVMVIVMNLVPSGNLSYLPYMPVLNPVDLTSIGSLFIIWKVLINQSSVLFTQSTRVIKALLILSAFVVLNAMMLRCFHYWYGMEYRLQPLMSSFMVQTALSLLWTLTAVVLMIYSTKRKLRYAWMLGMGLIIVVVIKLFLVDMSASGSIERIVAFLSVGILLSLVGYFSPIPPEEKQDKLANE